MPAYKYAYLTPRFGSFGNFPMCCSASTYNSFSVMPVDPNVIDNNMLPRLDAPHAVREVGSVKAAQTALKGCKFNANNPWPESSAIVSVGATNIAIPYKYMAMWVLAQMHRRCTNYSSGPRLIVAADNVFGKREHNGNSGVLFWLAKHQKKYGITITKTPKYYGAHGEDCMGFMVICDKKDDALRKRMLAKEWTNFLLEIERFKRATRRYTSTKAEKAKLAQDAQKSKEIANLALATWSVA